MAIASMSHAMLNRTTSTSYNAGFSSPAANLAALSIFGPFVALALVTNRLYWRLKKLGKVWYDDWCIVVSMVFLIAQSAALLAASDAGYGVDSEQLSKSSIQKALFVGWTSPVLLSGLISWAQYFFQVQIYYKITINLTKASIVLLYYRIFTTGSFRLVCLGVLTTIFIFGVTLTATTIFQCQPVAKMYTPGNTGTCLPHLILWQVNALYNILSDIIIILMPFPVLRSLNLPTGQFLGLALVLCCGIFLILTAILRYTTLSTAGHSQDPTAGTLTSTVWTEAEACVAIICACLPMMRVLLQRWLPFLRNISSRSDRSGYRSEHQHQPDSHHRHRNHYSQRPSELQQYEHLHDVHDRGNSRAAPSPIVPRLPSQRFSAHDLAFTVIEESKPEQEDVSTGVCPPVRRTMMCAPRG